MKTNKKTKKCVDSEAQFFLKGNSKLKITLEVNLPAVISYDMM